MEGNSLSCEESCLLIRLQLLFSSLSQLEYVATLLCGIGISQL